MIVSVSWLDLSDAQRRDLLMAMEESFGKTVRDPLRFWKRSCCVYFYYPEPSHLWTGYPEPSHLWAGYPRLFQPWTGVALTWSLLGTSGVEYMDKFFVRRGSPKGEGTRFLQELSRVTALVWRTDPILAERFYGRIPGVRTVARHGDYVYQEFYPIYLCQAVRAKVGHDALLGMIRIPSAF